MAGYLPDGTTDADIDRMYETFDEPFEDEHDRYVEEQLFEKGEIPRFDDVEDEIDYYKRDYERIHNVQLDDSVFRPLVDTNRILSLLGLDKIEKEMK